MRYWSNFVVMMLFGFSTKRIPIALFVSKKFSFFIFLLRFYAIIFLFNDFLNGRTSFLLSGLHRLQYIFFLLPFFASSQTINLFLLASLSYSFFYLLFVFYVKSFLFRRHMQKQNICGTLNRRETVLKT